MAELNDRLLSILDANEELRRQNRRAEYEAALEKVEEALRRAYAALAAQDYPVTGALQRLTYQGEVIAVWRVLDASDDYGIVAQLSASGMLFYNNCGAIYPYNHMTKHGTLFSSALHYSVATALDRLVERGFNLPPDGRYV